MDRKLAWASLRGGTAGTRWNGFHLFGLKQELDTVAELLKVVRCAIYAASRPKKDSSRIFNTLQPLREAFCESHEELTPLPVIAV